MAFEFAPTNELRAQALAVINYIQGSEGTKRPVDALYEWQVAAKKAGAAPSREDLEDMNAMVFRWHDYGQLPSC